MEEESRSRESPLLILHRVLDYIEEHRHQRIALSDLERVSGLNRYPLIRLFTRICDMTPIDYVRARRLAGSLPQLLGGASVLDVALDWGFEYEQSYIRAFKDCFGTTPARFRRNQEPVRVVERPTFQDVTVSANGLLGQPEMLIRPPFSMSGQLREINYADNMLHGTPLSEGLTVQTKGYFRAASRVADRNRFVHQYLVASPEATHCWQWPGGRWARFRYIGLHGLDGQGVQRLRLMLSLVIGIWMRQQKRVWQSDFLEEIDLDQLRSDYCEVEINCFLDALKRGETEAKKEVKTEETSRRWRSKTHISAERPPNGGR